MQSEMQSENMTHNATVAVEILCTLIHCFSYPQIFLKTCKKTTQLLSSLTASLASDLMVAVIYALATLKWNAMTPKRMGSWYVSHLTNVTWLPLLWGDQTVLLCQWEDDPALRKLLWPTLLSQPSYSASADRDRLCLYDASLVLWVQNSNKEEEKAGVEIEKNENEEK